MLSEIPYEQFLEWMLFAERNPFGEKRADFRSAQVVQAIVNMNRDSKKFPQPLPLSDFLLKFGQEPTKQSSWQKMKAVALMIVGR